MVQMTIYTAYISIKQWYDDEKHCEKETKIAFVTSNSNLNKEKTNHQELQHEKICDILIK